VLPNLQAEVYFENTDVTSPVVCQWGCRARSPIARDDFIPFSGAMSIDRGQESSDDGYAFALPGRDRRVLDPFDNCAATFVNDAWGPGSGPEAPIPMTHAEARAANPGKANVKFVQLYDPSGIAHVFWSAQRNIAAGEVIIGDYGDDYWKRDLSASNHSSVNGSDGGIAEERRSIAMKRLLMQLSGETAQNPVLVLDSNISGEGSEG
jgi:hypothetical protein